MAAAVSIVEKSPLVSRYYTKPGVNPLDEITWVKRTAKITEPDGTVVFEMEGEVPENFSQLATDIAISKYFRKAGLHGDKNIGETSFREVVERIVTKISEWGVTYNYFESEEEISAFRNELSFLLANQYGAFNSPVWFNCGLDIYGVKGNSQSWVWNGEKHKAITDAYSRPQCSACFIQSVDDDLGGIYDLAKNEAMLFKYGSGTGTNFSNIRAKQEKLSGGGNSSGLLSFLEVLNRGAGATKSGGTTRRAAKMVVLDMDHPEIEDFIRWKSREEKKAKALIAAGYPSNFNGEAYATVGGQNSNNSVRIPDKFMSAVFHDEKWPTTARTTGEVVAEYDAKYLWKLIAECAWECADPGVQYHDTINSWHTCKNTGSIRASNPCSEFVFLDNTACNLASLNLTKFLRDDGTFDIDGYRHAARVFTTAQEIIVGMSSYPTKALAKNSYEYRPLGLGYANLGTLLMLQSIPYDSPEGRAMCSALTAIMTGQAYTVSAEIAARLGPFAGYAANKDSMLDVMGKHLRSATNIDGKYCPAGWKAAACFDWERALQLGEKYGYRNAQATVLAPTGTIGLLMDCDTTGIEPDFSLLKFKKLAGGGYFKIVNQSVGSALRKLGFDKERAEKALEYILENGNLEGHIADERILKVFDCANKSGNGERYIAPIAHLEMMAAAQPFLSGAISKTVNLPNEATVEDIAQIYAQGWEMGLKAVALYRDGCKSSQPLNTKKDSTDEKLTQNLLELVKQLQDERDALQKKVTELETRVQPAPITNRRKLPSKRKGWTQESRVGGHKVFLRTGEYDDGQLGEIFIDMHKEGAALRSMMNCFAQSVSLGLQHGVPLDKYVEHFTFTRFEPHGLVEGHPNIKMSTSIVDFVFRVLGVEYLKKYDLAHIKPVPENKDEDLPQTEEYQPETIGAHHAKMMGDAPACDTCGHTTVRNGTCYRCLNCGNSMGCS